MNPSLATSRKGLFRTSVFNRVLACACVVILSVVVGSGAHAQCTPRWLPGESVPGTNGTVYASVVLPEGDVIVGGAFTVAGGVPAANIARWRASTGTWSNIGLGTNNSVFAIAALPSGDLVIGGMFTSANGLPANSIVRFNPTTNIWSTLGTGLTGGEVDALAVSPTGDVVAVGNFASAGGITVAGIARFSAATNTWSSLGAGGNRGLSSVLIHPSGDIYVGGNFGPGGFSANGIAKRSASGIWTTLGTGLQGGIANAIDVLPNGDILAGGPFITAGGSAAQGIARWSISTQIWSTYGAGITGSSHLINSILVLPGGDFVVGGNFTLAGNLSALNIAKCNSITGVWSPISAGTAAPVTTLSLRPGGGGGGSQDIIVGGGFLSAGGLAASRVARMDHLTTSWGVLGQGVDGTINAIATLPAAQGGDVFAGGAFTRAGTGPASNVARFHPATNFWTPLSSGVNGPVFCVASTSSGDIFFGGEFTTAGGGPANAIARWSTTTSTWSNLGAGITAPPQLARVNAISPLPSGDLYVSGAFSTAGGALASNVARWNASTSTWSPLGSGANSSVLALAILPGGDLLAGGVFSTAGGTPANALARWSETTHAWSAVGSGVSGSVYALLALPGGDVIVAGDFLLPIGGGGVTANNIARWNPSGNTWSTLSAGLEFQVNALALAPPEFGGDLIVGGSFTAAGALPASRIARWKFSPAGWSALATGMNAAVNAVAVHPGGNLSGSVAGNIFAGGPFTTAGGQISSYFATWTSHPTCAADFDCSATLDAADIFAFLSAWFASSPSANFNGINGVDVQDIFAFIAAWFAGCP